MHRLVETKIFVSSNLLIVIAIIIIDVIFNIQTFVFQLSQFIKIDIPLAITNKVIILTDYLDINVLVNFLLYVVRSVDIIMIMIMIIIKC